MHSRPSRRGSLARLAAVLFHDRDQEHGVGHQAQEIDGAVRLVGLAQHGHRQAPEAEEPEGSGEVAEEAVPRLLPEAEEVEADHPAERADDAVGEVRQRERAHPPSFTSARTRTASPMTAGSERTATMLTSGSTNRSTTRARSFRASPAKQRAAGSSSREGARRCALNSRAAQSPPTSTERT